MNTADYDNALDRLLAELRDGPASHAIARATDLLGWARTREQRLRSLLALGMSLAQDERHGDAREALEAALAIAHTFTERWTCTSELMRIP